MPAGSYFFQNPPHGLGPSSCGDCRGGADVHQINHRNRCVSFGKCRGDGCECVCAETRAPELGRHREPKKPGSPERINSFGREPPLPIVPSGGWGQHAIGNLFCFRKRRVMIHDSSDFENRVVE
jgi:hypothetical protein